MRFKHTNNKMFHELTVKSIVKGTICFETKKDAEPVHAVSGMIGKKEMHPLTDKGAAGATLELRPALIVINIELKL